MKYAHILQAVYETPWAIIPERLATILAILHERAAGYVPTAEEIHARLELHAVADHDALQAGPLPQRVTGSVARMPVFGILTQRGGMTETSEPLTSTIKLTQDFRQLVADDSVGAIVLDVDSPGGSVFGIQELADEIFRARGQKPIVAVANSMAASAAYWIASAAESIVITPGGMAGSIGVIAAHDDLSGALEREGIKITLITAGKYKGEGHPAQPLTDEARAAMQDLVDGYYDSFVGAVARNRGVKAAEVRGGFGEGRVVGAKQAVALGLADSIGTLDETMAGLMKGKRSSGGRAESGGTVPLAVARLRLNLSRPSEAHV